MSTLFVLLFLVFGVCFLLGLINPRIFNHIIKNANRKTTSIIFGLLAVGSLVGVGIAVSPHPQLQNSVLPDNKKNVTRKESFIFDIPGLLGRNIDGVRAVLGNPSDTDKEPTAQQLSLGVEEWSNVFKKGGRELLVTFNPRTRRVIDYFVSTADPSGVTKDTSELMVVANVINNAAQYEVEPVKTIKDPKLFTGIKIIPK